MKMAIALACGLLVSLGACAQNAESARPRWIIVMTITDLATGALVEERALDTELEFDDPNECKSVVIKAGPIRAPEGIAAVLTCRKIERKATSV
jgi:hypothetical protein